MSDSFLLWLLIPFGLVALWSILTFNRLVSLRNQVHAAWSDIDVQLKRRQDLLPLLVEAVKAYAQHEKATLASVLEQRNLALAARGPREQFVAETGVHSGVTSIMALAEAYPELKAAENFRKLQSDMVSIEDHIQHARRFYNGAVKLSNTLIDQFPALLVARPLGFRKAEYFDANLD